MANINISDLRLAGADLFLLKATSMIWLREKWRIHLVVVKNQLPSS